MTRPAARLGGSFCFWRTAATSRRRRLGRVGSENRRCAGSGGAEDRGCAGGGGTAKGRPPRPPRGRAPKTGAGRGGGARKMGAGRGGGAPKGGAAPAAGAVAPGGDAPKTAGAPGAWAATPGKPLAAAPVFMGRFGDGDHVAAPADP